ncbi:proton-conducting transporter membrane subunit [Fontisphaera persica]|uniref:complex I subunit 5 family protein n=1 Tax=Fontisphaera persica TaxID=2974023 RepID=UPI0024BFCDE7|nr:proton-conducting transporter membrane subunit [Fontisphaera persica]WCJ60680.1 proton-conducting transporter membrane subunit [Fontisphaera persica]
MTITPEYAVLAALIACALGAALALFTGRWPRVAGGVAMVAVVLTAAAILWGSALVLSEGPYRVLTLPLWKYFALRIYVDGLSAIFLLLIAVIAVPAALFSLPYMRHYAEYNAGHYYANLLMFLAGMIGLVTTTDAMFFFFIFWQVMTLTSYSLVRFEHKKPENCRAARRYLWMMQIACALTMIGAELLAGGAVITGASPLDRYDFEALHAQFPLLLTDKPWMVSASLALFLAGFGIKAGMWPFGQFWLPDAHPAAPSPVSALLSGVMIKTGVYGLMRYFLWLAPLEARNLSPLAGWGMALAWLGALTLLTGTLQALKQEQTKRLLAFHSIGQVGYILLALGAAMAFLSAQDPAADALAALAFVGALFHTVNHGLFKSLLFLNAGSLLAATGTQDLNRMGGLLRLMPVTAITALVASLSISGVPLFNGFASKWSIYTATIEGGAYVNYLPLLGVLAILTSALTLASFVKFFGSAFLGRRSEWIAAQLPAGQHFGHHALMRVPMVFLAFLCLLLGLVPALAVQLFQAALHASQQGLGEIFAHATPLQSSEWAGVDILMGEGRFAPLALAVVLAVMVGLAWGLSRLGQATRRADAPWLCGYVRETEDARFSAHHYYSEVKKHFRWLGGHPGNPPAKPEKSE